ncbi:hypothetical protein COBT_000841 [Conglomerata obtusa]
MLIDDLHYKQDIYTYKQFINTKQKINVGIDEAGRGPVLGHLVYAALITDQVTHPFKDSKQLTKVQRNNFFDIIHSNYSYIYSAIHPAYLSNEMSPKKSLNEISYSAVEGIIKEIKNNYIIEKVFLDALGPNEKYQQRMEKMFPGIKFVVENKADSKYAIVGGASIVAKVVRDNLLSNWNCDDKNFGSGYPGDDVTKKWLCRNFCKIFGFPKIVRFSWKTTKEFFDEREGINLKGKYSRFYLQDK